MLFLYDFLFCDAALCPVGVQKRRYAGLYRSLLFLHYGYLFYTALVASALKRNLEEFVHYLCRCLVVNKASGHNEHVGIVVLADEACDFRVPSNAGAHTVVLVQYHAYALTASADADAGINLAALNAFCKRMTEVGIVATDVAVCSVILIRITVFFQILYYILLKWEAGVVASKSDSLYFHR